jgi:cytochrome c-type biogenesis protein
MFGLELFDAALLPAMMIALAAGMLSFLSPCVLPIVPPYLAYMGGISMADMVGTGPGGAAAVAPAPEARRRTVAAALFFVLGLSTVFLILGFTASAFGMLFLQYQDVMTKLAGAVVIVFGLHFLGVFRIPLLMREARLDAGDRGGSALGAYVLGLAFAFGWTPCIGPILGAILSMAASEGDVARGTTLLGVYAAGLGVPFLLAAMFIHRAMGLMARLKRHMRLIERLMGALLVAVGIALLTGAFTAFSWWLLEVFPALGRIG